MPLWPSKDASDRTRRIRAFAQFQGAAAGLVPSPPFNPSSNQIDEVYNSVVAADAECCAGGGPTNPLRGSYLFGSDTEGAIVIGDAVRAGPDFAPAGDFTIEWMQYWTGGSNPRPFSIGTYTPGNITIAVSYEGDFYVWLDNGANSIGSQPNQNEWTHVAVVRSNDVVTVYINGVASASSTISGEVPQNDQNLTIGNQSDYAGSDGWYEGYITNFRWTNSAVYTADFTPDFTAELPILPDTVLLLTARPEDPWTDLTGRHTATPTTATATTVIPPNPPV